MSELIVPPEYRDRHAAGLARQVRSGVSTVLGQRVELPAMRKDGTRFPAEIAIVRIPIDGPPLFTGHIRDVSDRRRSDDALRESEARYRFLADTVPQQVWTAQPGGTLDYANRRAVEYFGVEPHEAGWDALVHPEDLTRFHECWGQARASGEAFEVEVRLRRHDGEHRWHIVRAEPLKGGTRGVERWFGSSTDIEEKKRHEARAATLLHEVDDQRRRLDTIVASVPGVVWDAWLQGPGSPHKIGFVSEHAVKLLGYPTSRWLETPDFWLEIVAPEDRERIRAEAAQLFARAEPGTLQFRWMRADGTRVWVQSWNVIIKDPLNRPVGMRAVTLDITPQKEAEEALLRSDERFRLLARATSDTVWDWDLATDELWWNENFTTMFGYPPSEVEPTIESWTSRLHPEDIARVRAAITAAIEGGAATWQDEYRFRRRDGTYAVIHDRGFLIRDPDGRAVRLLGSMMDVTARRRAEQDAARLAAIVQNSEDGVYGKSLDGRITDWNPGAERLYGYTREEIVGRSIQILVPPERIEEEQQILASIRDGKSVPSLETERIRKDGSRLALSLTVSPIRDARGALVGASAVARDISARKKAEADLVARAEELGRLTEALQRSNRELDQFAYITSHDLKAPLRGIANLSRWIEEDVGERLTPESKGHLELMRGRVQRMESLIDAILEYSRAGRVRAKAEPVDVKTLLDDVVDLLAPPEGFRIDLAPGLPTVTTERMRLQQVFMNLIGNAIKHHHDKARGRIVVSAEDAGRWWRFKVSDDGPGIAPRYHEKIFVIFQTLEARDKVEGTGIGLALVKKIVESFGGTITVDSDAGRGATFEFTWPK